MEDAAEALRRIASGVTAGGKNDDLTSVRSLSHAIVEHVNAVCLHQGRAPPSKELQHLVLAQHAAPTLSMVLVDYLVHFAMSRPSHPALEPIPAAAHSTTDVVTRTVDTLRVVRAQTSVRSLAHAVLEHLEIPRHHTVHTGTGLASMLTRSRL